MGYFRFRKTFSVLPGVKVNLSKTGVSTSVGGKGATLNIGHGKQNVTLGIPGTGLSYRTPASAQLVLIRPPPRSKMKRLPIARAVVPAPACLGTRPRAGEAGCGMAVRGLPRWRFFCPRPLILSHHSAMPRALPSRL